MVASPQFPNCRAVARSRHWVQRLVSRSSVEEISKPQRPAIPLRELLPAPGAGMLVAKKTRVASRRWRRQIARHETEQLSTARPGAPQPASEEARSSIAPPWSSVGGSNLSLWPIRHTHRGREQTWQARRMAPWEKRHSIAVREASPDAAIPTSTAKSRPQPQ